jgi:hypothetical protein
VHDAWRAVNIDSINRIFAPHEFNLFNFEAALIGVVYFERLGCRANSGKDSIKNQGVSGKAEVRFREEHLLVART